MADQDFASPAARPRLSRSTVCTQCRRQKQRCDRQTPCSNCRRREIPHLCFTPRRLPATGEESQIASPSSMPASSPHSSTEQRASSHPPQRIGDLWNSRGAPSYHGSSYFGHQNAADMIHVESPALPIGLRGIQARSSRRDVLRRFRRSEKSVYFHIWELVSYLPRSKATVDTLLQKFLDELNPIYGSVHEETFRKKYDAFWDRKWGDDDLATIDLRWLALLFMVLAFGELLDCPPNCSSELRSESGEASVQYFWASRKCLVIAPTFSGESPDLVRAGILISRYLVYLGRKNESWLTCSFAVRMAQGQGMHIDGESWGLPPKVLETRRRLWCELYAFDRSVSLAIGRPYTINDRQSTKMNIRNIWVDDKTEAEAWTAEEQPLHDPTPSMFHIYQQQLASALGHIHDECFGLSPLDTSYHTYEKVLSLDRMLLEWAASLPTYFRLEDPDCSMDQARPYLSWQRMYLHVVYHFARVTLHRAFVFLDSITDRFQYSRDACINSACADLKMKLSLRNLTMGDRLRSAATMHHLFNSGLVLGIVAVRDPSSPRTAAILQDLEAYCEKLDGDPWANEFVLAEVKVIRLCISTARKTGREGRRPEAQTSETTTQLTTAHLRQSSGSREPRPSETSVWPQSVFAMPTSEPYTETSDGEGRMEICENWLDSWFGPNRNFPEPLDYHLWEGLVGNLEARQ
ncbi:fungal-specific transcription factor domain-containing protein [Hypoxylon sp. NC1633]|nr:fungal-specific transcription factor domain-containing protein [Hypoxylon sp. NC1633]